MSTRQDQSQDQETPSMTPPETGQATRTGFREWITTHQERARKRAASKLTADDVVEALTVRRQRRATKKAAIAATEVAPRTGFARVAGVIVCLGVLLVGVALSVVQSDFRSASTVNEQTISALEGELVTTKSLLDPKLQQDRAKALEAQFRETHEKAEAVARLQQQFSALMHESTTTPDLGNGTPNTASLRVVEHRRALASFFSADSYVVEGPIAYAPGTVDDIADDHVDPRFPWFVRYEQGENGLSPIGNPVAAEPTAYTWTLASLIPSASGDPTMTDVTWFCKDSQTGDLLAWATASYSSERHDFNRLTVGTTSTGDRYAPKTANN